MPRPKKIVDESQSSAEQTEDIAKRTKTSYPPDIKASVAIEAIIGESTIAEIAKKYDIKTPQNIQQWKDEALKAIYLQFAKPSRRTRKSTDDNGKQTSRAGSVLEQASKMWAGLDK